MDTIIQHEENLLDNKLYTTATNLMKKINEIKNDKKSTIEIELRRIIELILEGANPDNLHDNFKINIYQFLCHILTFSDTRMQQLGLFMKIRLLCKLVLQLMFFKNLEQYLDTANRKSLFGYSTNLLQRINIESSTLLAELTYNSLLKYDYLTSFITKNVLLHLPSVLYNGNPWTFNESSEISKKLGQMLVVHCNTDQKKLTTLQKKSNAKIPMFSEIDGSSARDIFTVLNLSSTNQQDIMMNIYTFSVLKSWLLHLDSKNELSDCLNFNLSKLVRESTLGLNESPMSVGGSHFYEEMSSDSDSIASLTSSMSSLQSFAQNDDILDQFDFRRKQLSQNPLRFNDSRPQTPSRRPSQFDTISITSDIISNASNLLKIVTRYCLRIIQQSEKVPRHSSDRSVITSSTVECINILHLLCQDDSSISQKIYTEIKRLYKRIEKEPFSARRVFVALINFFIHHHEEMLISIDEILDAYFSVLPDTLYYKQTAVFELIQLCTDNYEFLSSKSEFVSKYLPNFLKLFVWWPITFTENITDIFKLSLTPTNVLEMFHAILDLPTLAALMHLRHEKIIDDNAKLYDVLKVEIRPYYHAMFSYILRRKSSGADTIDKLNQLYDALQLLSNIPRVKYAIKLVPYLLLEFFNILYSMEDRNLLKLLYPVLLERVFLLYPKTIKQDEIHEILCDQLINISKLSPDIITNNFDEVVSFLMQLQITPIYFPKCIIKIIWSIGEFTSNGYCSREQVTNMYDTLEMFLYEALQKLGSSPHNMNHVEVITSLILALSKLASYSQELIPKLTVCLDKFLALQFHRISEHVTWLQFVSIQQLTQQLIKVLQKPNVAPSLLCNPSRNHPWHLDKHNSLLLKIHVLINDEDCEKQDV